MRHLLVFFQLLKLLLSASCLVFMVASCGTQVGNPTDNDEPNKNSEKKPREPMSSRSTDTAVDPTVNSGAPAIENQSLKACVVSVTSQPLTAPQSAGSVTIMVLPVVDFKAWITAPGLASIEGKSLSLSSAGVYKFTVMPSQGSACSAEINISSDLEQKMVTATVTLPQ